MTARPVYVYRLDVVYPEGVDWRNPPPAWEPDTFVYGDGETADTTFHWPQIRQYLSARAAENRANLLRKYGATVTVVRSQPVEWPA
jgi:hypothetical protein